MQLTNELDQLSVPPTLRVLCRFLKQKMRQRQDCGHLSFDVTMTSWWRQWLWWRSIEVWKLYPNCALSSSAACVQNRTNKSIRRTREVNKNFLASKIQIPQLYVCRTVVDCTCGWQLSAISLCVGGRAGRSACVYRVITPRCHGCPVSGARSSPLAIFCQISAIANDVHRQRRKIRNVERRNAESCKPECWLSSRAVFRSEWRRLTWSLTCTD